jgi:hypothetical protein
MLRTQYVPTNSVGFFELVRSFEFFGEAGVSNPECVAQFGLDLRSVRKFSLHLASDTVHHGASAWIRFWFCFHIRIHLQN